MTYVLECYAHYRKMLWTMQGVAVFTRRRTCVILDPIIRSIILHEGEAVLF